jgi:serine/threonine protein kinase
MVGELRPQDPRSVGPYHLLGRLGSGGMGQVFLGRSAGGRLVTVKVIRPDLGGEPGFRTRFAREVAAARNVSGLFTALVVDADVEGPTTPTTTSSPTPSTTTTSPPTASPTP